MAGDYNMKHEYICVYNLMEFTNFNFYSEND